MKLGPLEIGGNVWCLGPLWVSVSRTTGGGGPVQLSWVNEGEAPWRYGRGLGVRLPGRRFLSGGIWVRQDLEALESRVRTGLRSKRPIDSWPDWDGDARGVLRAAAEEAEGDDEAGPLGPTEGDRDARSPLMG